MVEQLRERLNELNEIIDLEDFEGCTKFHVEFGPLTADEYNKLDVFMSSVPRDSPYDLTMLSQHKNDHFVSCTSNDDCLELKRRCNTFRLAERRRKGTRRLHQSCRYLTSPTHPCESFRRVKLTFFRSLPWSQMLEWHIPRSLEPKRNSSSS